jgi:dTDP-4-dehydrorhamnose 3,5-epimerase
MIVAGAALSGVAVKPLLGHVDERGDLHELMRLSSPGATPVAQWNAMHSRAGVLRGMAVHLRMTDCYVNVEGSTLLGLADLRLDSPTFGKACLIELHGDRPAVVVIPPGLAHGIYYLSDSVTLAALSHAYDPDDKLGCRWNDPMLAIPWPLISPRLVERDRHWPSAQGLVERVARRADLATA